MQTSTPWTAALGAFLLCAQAARSQPLAPPVGFRDDFAADSRAAYRTEGQVTWQPAQMILAPGASLVRKLPLGIRAEVRATVRLPRADGRHGMIVLIGGDTKFAGVALGSDKGQAYLVNLVKPREKIGFALSQGKEAAGPREWLLRCTLDYGLLRGKAWPRGAPEPKEWQTVRYAGATSWEPEEIQIQWDAGKEPGILTHLEVAAAARARPLPAKAQGQAARARGLRAEAMALARQGKFREALPKARAALGLLEQAYGPDHFLTAGGLGDVGFLHLRLGEFKEALPFLERAQAIQDRVLPPEHLHVWESLNNLGMAWGELGKDELALDCARRSLILGQRLLGKQHPETGRQFYNLGVALEKVARHQDARSAFERALAIHRKVVPADASDLGKTLHHLAVALARLGEVEAAQRSHEEAVAAWRKAVPPLPGAVATQLDHLGFFLMYRGQYGRARECFEEALALHQKVRGPEHLQTVRSLHFLGKALRDLQEYGQARARLEEALAMRRRARPPRPLDCAETLHVLGGLAREVGDLRAARAYHAEGLALRREVLGEGDLQVARSHTHLGRALSSLGDYPAARREHERALAICAKVAGGEHPAAAHALAALAQTLAQMGENRAAQHRLEEALAVAKKVLPADHPERLSIQAQLGSVLGNLGEYAAARALLEETLAAQRRVLGPDNVHVTQARYSLGQVLSFLGEIAAARKHLEETVAAFRTRLGKDHPHTAGCLMVLGGCLWKQGDHAAARRCLEEALEIKQRTLGKDHLHTTRTLVSLGLVLMSTGEAEEAWWRLSQAVDALGDLTPQWLAAGAEREHAALVGEWRRALERLLHLAELAPRVADRSELLRALLRWKAASGRALLARQEALALGKDPTLARTHQELKTARSLLTQAMVRGPGAEAAAKYRERLDELRGRAIRLERSLAERVSAFAVLQRTGQAGPKEVARALRADAALVEFVRYRLPVVRPGVALPADPDHYAALVLWPTEGGQPRPVVRVVFLGGAGPIEKAIRQWRAGAQKGEARPAGERQLRELLWEPLARTLPKHTRRLFLAPDGELALLPFEALRLSDERYVIEAFTVSYLTSGRDLLPTAVPRAPGKGGVAVILADPDYDAAGGTPGPLVKPTAGVAPSRAGQSFRRLPGFAREAEAVGRQLEGRPGWSVRRWLGAQASEEALARADRPRLLYCITHGFFLADQARRPAEDSFRDLDLVGSGMSQPALDADPRLRSGLALAGANRWKERADRGLSDGWLTALEVEDLDLWGTELVVLSACQTGLGEVQVGEGVRGLRRAFQLAGAKSVAASLWKVPDAETERLMTAFLQKWLQGQAPAEALRAAQLEMIRHLQADANATRRQAPPLYWAGFICHGQGP